MNTYWLISEHPSLSAKRKISTNLKEKMREDRLTSISSDEVKSQNNEITAFPPSTSSLTKQKGKLTYQTSFGNIL